MDNNFYTHQLANGIKIIHQQVKSTQIAHCGLILNIGSRDEKPHQQGIAHFWEHMAFKGTNKRKAYHILNRLDSVGGELNAYTTKEKICFYASALVEHFDKSAEIISDITFHSTFPEKEIIKEKGVILEEMSMYLDDPSDAIMDEFDELIFKDHPLGKNILGNKESVNSFTQDDFRDFIAENLNTHEIVFSSVSNLPFEKVLKVAEKYLSDIQESIVERERLTFGGYQPIIKEHHKAITQAHCTIGRESYPMKNDKRLPFFMLINLLGGPAMNSRLNLEVREKHGYVYDISANLVSFKDTGLFTINFATEINTLEKCKKLIYKELKRVSDQALGVRQLEASKQQLMGQIAMSEESNLSMMLAMGKSYLDRNGKMETLEELFEKINSVSAEQIQFVAQEMFNPEELSTLTYIPQK